MTQNISYCFVIVEVTLEFVDNRDSIHSILYNEYIISRQIRMGL